MGRIWIGFGHMSIIRYIARTYFSVNHTNFPLQVFFPGFRRVINTVLFACFSRAFFPGFHLGFKWLTHILPLCRFLLYMFIHYA